MSKKKLPKFRSEDHEREFWSKTDSTNYVDWEGAKRIVLPQLKPKPEGHLASASCDDAGEIESAR